MVAGEGRGVCRLLQHKQENIGEKSKSIVSGLGRIQTGVKISLRKQH